MDFTLSKEHELSLIHISTSAAGKDYIKWVDFTVSYEALCQAYDWDVDTSVSYTHLDVYKRQRLSLSWHRHRH